MSTLAEEMAKEIVTKFPGAGRTIGEEGAYELIAVMIDKHLNASALSKSLRAVIININRNRKIERRVPLWSAVADFCGLGSTSASALCIQLGFDPDVIVGKENPPKQS